MTARWLEMVKDVVFPDRETHAIPMMDGPLRPNGALDECTVLGDSPQMSQPDDLTFTSDGTLLASSGNKVFRADGEVAAQFDGLVTGIAALANGGLAACVDGIGVVLDNGQRLESVDGSPLSCLTAVLAGPDNVLFIAQGSSKHNAPDWVRDLMEKNASGRVIRWDLNTDTAETLIDDLAYPYGLALDHDGKSLLVTESWSHVLFKLPLNVPAGQGRREIVIPNMPGYPARITSSDDGGYWMCLFAMRTEMLEFVLEEDAYREQMMKTVDPAYWVRPTLRADRHFLEPLQGGGFRVLGIIKPWAPPRSYGLVVQLDEDYEVVRSLHSRADGRRHGVTGIAAYGGLVAAAVKGDDKIIRIVEEGQL
ncbi:MAG: SMP-30/gluconolactonase/LRE family protein [Rhodospirillaceae bacterium]|jgi:hypothetical protein|nr:SMP-30/gluconolactonase/LRE family protein [Rhodospirillaceae bacterium]MBT3491978.1 SMP-30/gluconolactonase/LRE family protein [Rhodospirillaceae bacterium]MBT3779230.1 SMP-30/gluconolactonase/LRE family protein [Rhodospirillaceae bacterium]MBT3979657.1 SMP-30/gluconolactonase/LRE family protein [Rhodospirillaceae bacterium]MBT4169389.1 SMP-30/gluconolactonase/LRE family protein [Rhodospirillaceae bacterium]